ncbi:hypothetical protein RJZ57_007067 [Blastomyces gilchristii]
MTSSGFELATLFLVLNLQITARHLPRYFSHPHLTDASVFKAFIRTASGINLKDPLSPQEFQLAKVNKTSYVLKRFENHEYFKPRKRALSTGIL